MKRSHTYFADPETGERRKVRPGDPGRTARVCGCAMGTAGASEAKVLDPQAAIESTLQVVLSGLGGAIWMDRSGMGDEEIAPNTSSSWPFMRRLGPRPGRSEAEKGLFRRGLAPPGLPGVPHIRISLTGY